MGGRFAVLTLLAALGFAQTAQAEDFSLTHSHSGQEDARADGSVTFPDAGGAEFSVSVTDRSEDGWCAQVWVSSNVAIPAHDDFRACGVTVQKTYALSLPGGARCNVGFVRDKGPEGLSSLAIHFDAKGQAGGRGLFDLCDGLLGEIQIRAGGRERLLRHP